MDIVGRIADMFQVNDVIVYGAQGVCRIIGTEEKTISGKKKRYYVLQSVNDSGSTIFAPMDNEVVLKKMRRLLSKDEIHTLIDSMPRENPLWVENENERRDLYKGILSRGNHLELIQMVKAIHAHKQQREAQGKRLHMSDERFFKDAEQLLYNEFQYVLGLHDKTELMQYIFQRIQQKDL